MKVETGQNARFEKARIPDDVYPAIFKGTREIKDGKYGKRAAFLFEVDYNGNKIELAKLVYIKKATPKNDIGTVMMALGAALDGKEVDIDSFIGTRCRVVVEDYDYDDNGTKKIASTIDKVKSIADRPLTV